jgi:ankyrin repeat protein
LEIVKYLINFGADITATTSLGISILKIASSKNNLLVLDFLLQNGAEDNLLQNCQLINFYFSSLKPLVFYKNLSKPLLIHNFIDNTCRFNPFHLVHFLFSLPISYGAKDARLSKSEEFYRLYNIYDSRQPDITIIRISCSKDFDFSKIELIDWSVSLNVITSRNKNGFKYQFYEDLSYSPTGIKSIKFEQFEALQSSHPYKKNREDNDEKFSCLLFCIIYSRCFCPKNTN